MTDQKHAREAGTPTRKIAAGLFMSLDGVVESPSQWGFQYMTDEMGKGITSGLAQADAVLLGRRTYLEFAELWPKQGSDVLMADFLNRSPKYVVSATLDTLAWQPATLIKGNLVQELKKLKRQPGGTIQIPGSPKLVRALLRDGLLDVLSLAICPIVVGSGMRLFDEITKQVPLKLLHATVLGTGALGATYQPVRAGNENPEPAMSFPDAASRK
jgi:dihydrofolate reductase